MSTLLDNIKRTTQAFIDGYSEWNIDSIMEYRDEKCTQTLSPKSLGDISWTNEGYRKYFSIMMTLFHDFNVWAEDQTYDVIARKSAFRMHSVATSSIGKYSTEYAIFLDLNEDGTKVTRIVEMVDTAYSAKFFGQLMEHARSQGDEKERAWLIAVEASNMVSKKADKDE